MILPKELAQALIEHIDLEYLQNNQRVVDKENYLLHVESHMKNAFNISWSKGGDYGSCWSEELTKIDPEDEPPMKELDKFLSNYYPSLSEDNKAFVYSWVVESDTYENDYYGGTTTQGNKSLSFEALASSLCQIVYKDKTNSDLEIIDFNQLVQEHANVVINMSLQDYPKLNLFKELSKNLESNKTTKKIKKMKV